MNVTVWGENVHEAARRARARDLSRRHARGDRRAGSPRCSASGRPCAPRRSRSPSTGSAQDVLDATDVLTWWGHAAHDEVDDAVVERVHERVLGGMGLLALHSGHYSKIFQAPARHVVQPALAQRGRARARVDGRPGAPDRRRRAAADRDRRPGDVRRALRHPAARRARVHQLVRRRRGVPRRLLLHAAARGRGSSTSARAIRSTRSTTTPTCSGCIANAVLWAAPVAAGRGRSPDAARMVRGCLAPTARCAASSPAPGSSGRSGRASWSRAPTPSSSGGWTWTRRACAPQADAAGSVACRRARLSAAMLARGGPTSWSTSRLRRRTGGDARRARGRRGRPEREADGASLAAAREMVAAADAPAACLMVSQNRRYKPTLQAFRDDGRRASGRSRASPATSTSRTARMRPGSCSSSRSRCCSTWRSTSSTRPASSPAPSPVSVYCESYNPPWGWFAGPGAANAIFRMSGDVRFAFNGAGRDGFLDVVDGAWRAVGEHGSATWDGQGAPRVQAGPDASSPRRRRSRAAPVAHPLPGPGGRAGRVRRGAAHRPGASRARATTTCAASPCATRRWSPPRRGVPAPVSAE